MMIKKIFTAITFLSLFFAYMPTYAANIEQQCKALLDQKLHIWTMSSVKDNVKKYAAEQKIDPVKIYGDFDGDGRKDIALMIQNRSRPVLELSSRLLATRVAVCLDKKPTVILRVIKNPYCVDYIFLVKKGGRMYDSNAGDHGKYPHDAIATIAYRATDAVYYFDGNKIRVDIDND